MGSIFARMDVTSSPIKEHTWVCRPSGKETRREDGTRTYAVYGAVFSFNQASRSELDHFLSWKYCYNVVSHGRVRDVTNGPTRV